MSEHWSPPVSSLCAELGDASVAVSCHLDPDRMPLARPLTQPIVHTATYRFASIQHYQDILAEGGYIYSRLGNPSVEAAECAINSLERGAGTLLFSSGSCAAFSVFMANLEAGDHMICVNPVYSGIHKMVSQYLPQYGVRVSWVPAGAPVQRLRELITPRTKVVYVESPCNPVNAITDLEHLGQLSREHREHRGEVSPEHRDGEEHRGDMITVVDSTFATPMLQKPITLGVDVVIHSCTKYMGGHNDLVAGSVTLRTKEMWTKLNIFRATMGTVMSPFDASLLLRGIRTLPIRMERHCSNAMRIAKLLEGHEKVDKVYYPGLESFPQHDLARRQMSGGYGGMVTFEMKGGYEAARRVNEGVKLIQLAVSLGDVESLMNHPASMTHGNMVMSDEERCRAGITPNMLRLSVGIESIEDLERDLTQALDLA